ncbi:ATP-binding cassette domain-containing protein [Sphingobacterium lactis]|uniref:ABC-type bacteriocin/lantibiotic exporter, contains an N-terminal double-glycine peptidase domain n=1 Tax=Sphingobacterium lactis TaxID=797291 RepID=A0A1H6CLI6_9SPHI|nr:ABC transporter ATP-binding protein [Sphingobacterium lactis]SEG73286.1 ABC-type bacteriocin/lantibiotic exporter, contains an N-terminal double-glycine peptidase domain [Sphingobacterium lactis]
MLNKFKYQFKWAWGQAKPFKWSLLIYFLLELVAIGCSLLFVIWSKHAIDYAISPEKGNFNQALFFTVFYIVLGLILRTLASWINDRTKSKMLIHLQNVLIKNQMLSTWKVVKQWHTGDVLIRVNNDASDIVQMISSTFIGLLLTIIRLVASFILLWSMDPMLAFLILAISPLFLFSKLYYKQLRKINRSLKNAESNLGKTVQENLRFRVSLRALGLQGFRWQKIENNQTEIYNLKMNLLNFSTVSQGTLKLLVNAGFLLTFVWSVYKLQSNEISFGMMTAFLQLVGRIQTPLLAMLGFVPVFIRYRTSVERLQELIDTEIEQEEEPEVIPAPQELVIRDLSFKYEDSDVIEDFNLKVRVGEPTAIIGSSGKGKTTLIRLLLALIKPDKGTIHIKNSQGTIAINPKHRVNIAYVPQGDKLFSGTVRENIITDSKELTDKKLTEVLYLSCAEFVHDLPQGLDTVIGESGFGLSEGQAQRIALARALMKDSSIWLFDEVTSALDQQTSEKLITRLLSKANDKLVIFVTHDLKLADRCSQSVYMQ